MDAVANAHHGNEVLVAAINMYTRKVQELKESPGDTRLEEDKKQLLDYVWEVAQIQNKKIDEMRQKVAIEEKDKPSEIDSGVPGKPNVSRSNSPRKTRAKKIATLMGQRMERRKSNIEEKRDSNKIASVVKKENETESSTLGNVKPQEESFTSGVSSFGIDDLNSSAERFLFTLELIPTNVLHLRSHQKAIKRGTRQKKSTANHSQYLYDDPWEDEVKKKPTVSLHNVKPPLGEFQPPTLAVKELTGPVESKPTMSTPEKVKKSDPAKPAAKKTRAAKPKPVVPIVQPRMILPKESQESCLIALDVSVKNKKTRQSYSKPVKAMRMNSAGDKQISAPKSSDLGGYAVKSATTSLTSPGSGSKPPLLLPGSGSKPPLSLLFPGLPTSLTIERIVDREEMCYICKKMGVLLVAGPKVFNNQAIEMCTNCKKHFHLMCSPSTSSSQSHYCPSCTSKHPIEPAKQTYDESFTIIDGSGRVLDNERKKALISRNRSLLQQRTNLTIVKAQISTALQLQTAKLRKLTDTQQSMVAMITNIQATVNLFQRSDG